MLQALVDTLALSIRLWMVHRGVEQLCADERELFMPKCAREELVTVGDD